MQSQMLPPRTRRQYLRLIGMSVFAGASVCMLSRVIAATTRKSQASDGTAQTTQFVGASAETDMFQIETGRLAAKKSRMADTKYFAEIMVAVHTDTSRQLQKIAITGGLAKLMPVAMSTRRVGELQQLRALPSAQFDRNYLETQIDMHRETAILFEDYASSGADSALREFATRTLIDIKQYLQHARTLAQRASIAA